MWTRLAAPRLKRLWRQFPSVLILGARQVGKTTIARQAFPTLPYCDLEELRIRERFLDDPTFEIQKREQKGLILDEAQSVPSIFAALRGLIDAQRNRKGRFLLLGSAQPAMIREVSESLAGRVGIIELDPLTVVETSTGTPRLAWEEIWLRGGFPDAAQGAFRTWWESYLRTYIERDLPHLGIGAQPRLLRRLLTMLAHAQGGLLNTSQLGQALGVSYHTIQRYLDILEQTFLIRRLPPYHRNIRKRLVKTPKVYIRDTGLLHHLLNIGSLTELDQHPIRGLSWETFVMEDLIRRESLRHPHTMFHFWRTAVGSEIDLVLDRGSSRIAIEIKVGRGDKVEVARAVELAARDLQAEQAWIIAQSPGTEPLRPTVMRIGIPAAFDWLPPHAGT